MSLTDFSKQIPSFSTFSHAEKVKHFGWFLLNIKGQDTFRVAEIRNCYETLHFDVPANLSRSIDALTEKSPPELLKKSGGHYRLHANVRSALDQKYGQLESTVTVEKALAELPGKIADEAERLFLQEAIICYRHNAFRSAIVMTWNLAYDHLLRWILSDAPRLAAFNTGIPARNPKKAYVRIQQRDDFEELKEDEVIDIAGNLSGITGGMKKVLKEKLGRRNTYAHPSIMQIAKPQVDDMITDLVNNIVLRLT